MPKGQLQQLQNYQVRVSAAWLILLLFILLPSYCFPQIRNVGPITSWKQIGNGIEGKTTRAIFEVKAWSNNIIRVRLSNTAAFKPLPYALVNTQAPIFSGANIFQNNNQIILRTSAIEVIIDQQPAFRITFKNRNGTIINEDVAGEGFGTTFLGDKVSIYKQLQEGERFVGLGEALGNLDRRGTGVTLNNTDTYKYGDPRLAMYSSIPFYMGIHHQQVYGIFFNNSYPAFFNFGLSTPHFSSANFEGGDADYFFCYDTSISKLIEHYTSLTGRISLPPKWSIGYHQSRCSYFPQSQVNWIAQSFRQKQIPLDCIVLDADYQQGYQPFRVNEERFPDMPKLAKELSSQNIELTASVYPGVKIDSTYFSYTDGLKQDVFIKYGNGDLFETEIAPLKCYLPDYTNPKSRQWWIKRMKWLPDNGIHGYWNDMNEPAVGGSYLPDNLWFDFDGRKANALEAKNVYGFQMARSSYEAALKNDPTRRPFILTRSGFAGVQRYSAMWSGDNTSKDEYLLNGVLLNNTMGLSGVPFIGYDLGGYIGDASKDLYKRWIEVGVFSPFCRNHREFFGAAGEPWSYGEEAEAISKSFIGFRYRLLPYLYSAFQQATQTGMPIARSLCIDYPFNSKVYDANYQYQFQFGDALMVIPVNTQEKYKKCFLPAGTWYNLYTDEKTEGEREWTEEVPIYQIPIFVRGGAIIPMQSLVQSTKDKPGDTLFLHVYAGKEKNTFHWYEDEGDGFGYQSGNYAQRTIEWNPNQREINIGAASGSFTSPFKFIQLILHGVDDITGMEVNGIATPLQSTTCTLLDPLENLQGIYDPGYFSQLRASLPVKPLPSITVPNQTSAIRFRYQNRLSTN